MRPPWIRTLYRIESNQTLSAAWVDDAGKIREARSEDQKMRDWLRGKRWSEVAKTLGERGGVVVDMGRRMVVGKVNKE